MSTTPLPAGSMPNQTMTPRADTRARCDDSPTSSDRDVRGCAVALTAFAVAWFAVLVMSAVSSPAPVVLSDETTYLLTTLYGYRSDNFTRWAIIPQIPDLLYYALYALLPHGHFYVTAKFLNAGFIAASAFPAYLLARIYLTPRASGLFAGLVICAPICTFARYFMPESLFYFGFWWTVLGVLRLLAHESGRVHSQRQLLAAITGAVCLALLSLVKPHALALVIAMAAFLALRPSPAMTRVVSVFTLVCVWYLVRTGLAFVLSGRLDWSISGPSYAQLLFSGAAPLLPLLQNLAGHLATLALLVGVPLAAVAAVVIGARTRKHPTMDLALLALCVVGALVAMTVYFSYSVHAGDPGEPIARLHGRYYAYALPLLILAFMAVHRSAMQTVPRIRRALPAAAAVSLVAWIVIARGYGVTVIDYPELGLFMKWPTGLLVPATAIIACAWAVFWRRGHGGCHGTLHRVAITWWSAIAVTTSLLLLLSPFVGKFFVSDPIDRVLMEDGTLQRLRHRSDGLIVGSHALPADAYRVMFHLESMSRGLLVDAGASVDSPGPDGTVAWMILLPGVGYAGPGQVMQVGPLRYVTLP